MKPVTIFHVLAFTWVLVCRIRRYSINKCLPFGFGYEYQTISDRDYLWSHSHVDTRGNEGQQEQKGFVSFI